MHCNSSFDLHIFVLKRRHFCGKLFDAEINPALSHALKYAKTVGKGVIVLVHKPFGSRYRLIFGEPDVQFLQLVERWPSKCTYKMTYKKSFYKFPFTEYTPILRLKDVYTAAAKKKIGKNSGVIITYFVCWNNEIQCVL